MRCFAPEYLGCVIGRIWCCKESWKPAQMAQLVWIWVEVVLECTFRSAHLMLMGYDVENPEILHREKKELIVPQLAENDLKMITNTQSWQSRCREKPLLWIEFWFGVSIIIIIIIIPVRLNHPRDPLYKRLSLTNIKDLFLSFFKKSFLIHSLQWYQK